jgi:hypothetical protein
MTLAILGATILLADMVLDAELVGLDDLYTADAIVTGRSEETRQPGFEDCSAPGGVSISHPAGRRTR